jgi:hypothetical protein
MTDTASGEKVSQRSPLVTPTSTAQLPTTGEQKHQRSEPHRNQAEGLDSQQLRGLGKQRKDTAKG